VGAAIQVFKDFFLSFTTLLIIFRFLYDYQKGVYWYLLLYAIIALIGFNRVTYNENILIPLFVFISVSLRSSKKYKPNRTYIFFFLYALLITYINNLSIIDASSEGIYLFAIILIFSEYLFKEENQVATIVFLIWLITIGLAINSIMFGKNIFSTSTIDPAERALILNNGIVGSSSNDAGIDLNYFGCSQAIGALITIMFIYYRKYFLSAIAVPVALKSIIRNILFTYILYILLALEVWLVLRGVSRGALLVLLAGIITFLLTLKKFKYLFYGGLLLFILYLITNHLGIIQLFAERIDDDPSGTSGRNLIWLAILGAVYHQGGIIQIIFGGGIGWPWWKFWTENFWDKGVIPSTHNQWLSLYVNVGLVGLVLFVIPIVKGLKNNIQNNNPINNIRIVLFACIFFESLSLEPLQFDRYVWFLLALVTTYTPNTDEIYEYLLNYSNTSKY
jgi:hypothetical protein